MATDNSSSLSKDETIEQLRETIGQLETVVQKLEETTVAELPSSDSLQNLSTTTSELEAIIAQEVVTQETTSQEAENQAEQQQLSQEGDAILGLTTPETEQEAVSPEQVIEIPEQSDDESEAEDSLVLVEEIEQEVVPSEPVVETSEQTEPENTLTSEEEIEQVVVPTEQVLETPDQSNEVENSENLKEPEISEPEVTEPEAPELEATEPEIIEPEVLEDRAKKPLKQAAKASDKKKRKAKKIKPKNQAPKKKKGWLVGVVVAAIAVAAITLTLKFAPISELPQLLASNSVVDKPANKAKTNNSVINSPLDLPLETPTEIEEVTEDFPKVDLEEIASLPNEDYQLDESTQAEPTQINSAPAELDSEQQTIASRPEPEAELEPGNEQELIQEAELNESEEGQEPVVVLAEEPEPITKLTSEQNLIVALGRKTDSLAQRYDDDLIVAINPDFVASVVNVTLSDDWYGLVENRQDRLLGEMFRRSQQLEFDKLMITDSDDNLIARSPVIGKEMVIFRRTS